jgi:ATP-dependent DNA helicase RecG
VRSQEAASIDDLDLNLFHSTVLPALVSRETIAENGRPIDQQLSSLKIASPNGFPTVMGLLLIGVNPTEFLPGGYLQFVRYDGTGVEAPVSDAQELRSNVINVADRLQNVLRGHLHTSLVSVDGFREEDRPNYPLEALREVCMNAIIHRNYESSNAPIMITWFNDRIEVTNPGGPFGQVNSDNFDRVNDYRNPSLAGAMKDLGYVNRFGRGIGRVRAALEANGNPPLVFAVDDSSWTVIMRGSK